MKTPWRVLAVLTALLLGGTSCLRAAQGDDDEENAPSRPVPTEETPLEAQDQSDNAGGLDEQSQPPTDNTSGFQQRPNRVDRTRTRESGNSGTRTQNPPFQAADSRRDDRTAARATRRDAAGRSRTGGGRRGDSRPSAPPSESGAPTNSGRDSTPFKLITDRNIFNSARSARGSRPAPDTRRRPSPETLTLVGTMSYDKGAYAFFDGSRPDYRKVLEIGTSIADHTLLAVSTDAVTLQATTNTFELRIGGQLRRGEDRWEIVPGSAPAREAGSANPSSALAAPGDEDEVVRRLMQQREQELK